MPPTLLADLAVMMASSPEDVATRALELILRGSPAARAATTRLLDTWRGRQGKPITRWASQVGGEDEGRTDLQGFDAREEPVAILENKFWAGLTDNQPSTYLTRLRGADGILAFVVPARRVALIANELSVRIRGKGETSVAFSREGEADIAHLPSGCTIAVSSWSVVLSAVGAALEAAEEYDKRADLHQLEGLVAKMETEGYRPFTSADLTGDTPHLVLQLCDLVDAAVEQLLMRPFANKKNLKATAGQGWYGHYLRIHGYGCQLVMSSSRWSAHGVSPVWLRVSSSDWTFQEDLRLPLRGAVEDGAWVQEEHGYSVGFWIPIRLVEGLDRDAVVRDVLRQLDRVASALGAQPSIPLPSQPPVPPPLAGEEVLPPALG
jgi:hypothetical protein